MSETKTFADFGVAPDFCEALAEAGITAPFPIQELTLPLGMAGADVIGQARTGTGKTLAFGLPLLQRIDDSQQRPQALVIVPTRELCVQVRGDLDRASARRATRVVAVYGGKSIDEQATALATGAPVVVGTPGRLLDLNRRGILDLAAVRILVLDEADEMLDLGFLPDVEQLIEATAEKRQTLLFSATMPSAVVALARRYMRKPTFLRAEVEEARIAPETEQHFFSCHRMDKPAVLARILQTPKRGLCVVFTRTKRMADVLASELRDRDIAASPIHSDLRQEARERALSRFREGKIDVLVATEVAARGLDIDDVTHVVNYDCPDDEKMYLHRIGRTGRAGMAGVAITLAVWNELARLEMIKKALDVAAPTHEVFSTSPILDELFDLPERPARRQPAARDQAPTSRRSTGKGSGRKPSTSGRGRSERGKTKSGRADERTTASSGDAPAAAAPPAPPSSDRAGEDSVRRRRVRTRTRRGRSDPGTDPADRQPAEPQPAQPAAADGRPSTEDTPARAETPAVRHRPARQRSRSKRRGSGDGQTGRDAQPSRRRRRSAESPREESRPHVAHSDAGASGGEPPSADDKRGPGKPALNRPMAITHLP